VGCCSSTLSDIPGAGSVRPSPYHCIRVGLRQNRVTELPGAALERTKLWTLRTDGIGKETTFSVKALEQSIFAFD
jgi:hypothetical protein